MKTIALWLKLYKCPASWKAGVLFPAVGSPIPWAPGHSEKLICPVRISQKSPTNAGANANKSGNTPQRAACHTLSFGPACAGRSRFLLMPFATAPAQRPCEKMSILDRLFKFEYLFCAAVFYLALQTARLKEGPMPFSFVRNLMLGHKNSVQQSANSAQWIIIFLSDLNIQSLCTFGLLASVLPRSRSVALFLFQIETYGVYTKAFACRGWAVIKHMPQVRAAPRAGNLGARHAERRIRMRFYCTWKCCVKARPTGSWIESRVRREERIPARGAGIGAVCFLVHVLARKRRFRSAFT